MLTTYQTSTRSVTMVLKIKEIKLYNNLKIILLQISNSNKYKLFPKTEWIKILVENEKLENRGRKV